MNLMTSGVVRGLIGASSQIKMADVSMAVYSKEANKNNPDQEKLKRALGYATDSMDGAMKEKKNTTEALEKAQDKAAKLEEAEQAVALEKAKAEKAAANQNTSTDSNASPNKDTVDISTEGKETVALQEAEKAQKTVEASNTSSQTDSIDMATPELSPSTYSASGEVLAMEAQAKNTFSAVA